VALVSRDQDRLGELGESLGISSERWLAVAGELTDADAAAAVAQRVTREWGRIDVLVHLVGGWVGGTAIVDLDHDELRGMLDQHLWSTLHIVQHVVPGMIDRGFGRVMGVSSPFATDIRARRASYAIGKAAEEVLLRTLAREVAGTGVTVNLVVVQTIDAKREREATPSGSNASWTTPEELADTLAYLASDGAAAVNGERISLNGRG
jgi:NAD(P)-dependent dehydrogenase (short-subunit alcohol dehydrogenase family)